MAPHEVHAYTAKAGTVWGSWWFGGWLQGIGVNDWGELAQMLAAILSFLYICEWVWKKWKAWRE